MTTQKTPNIETATVTARILSRIIRKAGFDMANTSDRYNWTEGVYVRRIGLSRTISIGYHIPHKYDSDTVKEYRRQLIQKLRLYLQSRGYVLDDTSGGIHITCKRAD